MAGSTQIAIVGFRELDVLDGWSIAVLVGGVVSGRIHRGDDRTYRYFEGPCNEITWSFADQDLERLKDASARHCGTEPVNRNETVGS